MKETKLYVARIFNFCTQSLSDVTGFTTNTQKIFGMDATIRHALSGKTMGNQAFYGVSLLIPHLCDIFSPQCIPKKIS